MNTHQPLERQPGATIRRATPATTPTADSGPEAHPLLRLQRQIGNAQIARLLAQRQEVPEEEELQAKHDPDLAQRQEMPEEEELQAKHDLAQRQEMPEEEELQAKHDLAQRQEAPEEEELQAKHDLAQRQGDEEEELQARHDPALAQREPEVGLDGGPVSSGLADRINAQRGQGAALDDSTRATMEGSFGTSFEDVRLHTSGEAAALNRSVSARAFTTGNDIFLGEHASPSDHGLMAHELSHVVQQRSMQSSGPMTVSPAGDTHEQAADAAAAAVTLGAAPAPAQRKLDHET